MMSPLQKFVAIKGDFTPWLERRATHKPTRSFLNINAHYTHLSLTCVWIELLNNNLMGIGSQAEREWKSQ